MTKNKNITIGVGTKANASLFCPTEVTIEELSQLFSQAEEGEKDGLCFNPVSVWSLEEGEEGYRRTLDNVKAMTCIVYDVDYCNDAVAVIDAITEMWDFQWFAHTSYSHMTTTTTSLVSRFDDYSDTDDIHESAIQEYYSVERGFETGDVTILSHDRNERDKPTISFSHDPIHKLRIIIPLEHPHFDKKTWQQVYDQPMRLAGIETECDETGSLQNRYFFTARYAKGKKDEFASYQSTHENLYVPEGATSEEVSTDHLSYITSDGQTIRVKTFLNQQEAVDIEALLADKFPAAVKKDRKHGGTFIQCPYEDNHTEINPTSTYAHNAHTGFIMFCSHEGCRSKKQHDFFGQLLLNQATDGNSLSMSELKKYCSKKVTPGNALDMLNVARNQIREEVLSKEQSLDLSAFLKKSAELEPTPEGLIELAQLMQDYGDKDDLVGFADMMSVSPFGKDELERAMHSAEIVKQTTLLKMVGSVRRRDTKGLDSSLATLAKLECSIPERESTITALSEYHMVARSKVKQDYLLKLSRMVTEPKLQAVYANLDETYAVYNAADRPRYINLRSTSLSSNPVEFIDNWKTLVNDTISPIMMSDSCLKMDYPNSTVYIEGDNGESISFDAVKGWRERQTGKAIVNRISFDPKTTETLVLGDDGNYSYNLWRGFKSPIHSCPDPEDEGLKMFRRHVLAHCGGNEENFNWFMLWLASLFQRPHIRYPTAVIIQGGSGTGKSLITDEFIGKLLYPYYTSTEEVDDVIGLGKTLVQSKLLCMLDDATFAGSPGQQRKLRAFISAPSMVVKEVYMPKYKLSNFLRLLLTTNDDHVANIDVKDRRYFITAASLKWEKDHQQDKVYFTKLIDFSNNLKTLGAIKHYFENVTPEELGLTWGDLQKAPESELKVEQLHKSFSKGQIFIKDLITHGMIYISKTDSAVLWHMDETLPVAYNELEMWLEAYKNDVLNYDKMDLVKILRIFGCSDMYAYSSGVSYSGVANATSNITRREAIENLMKEGIITQEGMSIAHGIGDSEITKWQAKSGSNNPYASGMNGSGGSKGW